MVHSTRHCSEHLALVPLPSRTTFSFKYRKVNVFAFSNRSEGYYMQLQGTTFIFRRCIFFSLTLNTEEYMTRHDKQFPRNTHLTFSNILPFMAGSSNCETAHLQTCLRGVGGFNENPLPLDCSCMHKKQGPQLKPSGWESSNQG